MNSHDNSVPLSLCTLARELERGATILERQLTRERAELDWQTKKRPRVPQAPPCGLFEQTQGSLL